MTKRKHRRALTIDHEEEVLKGLVSAWIHLRPQLTGVPTACVLAANFARQILPRLYVSVWVRPIGVTVFNSHGWEQITYGHPLTGKGWSVGCSSRFTNDTPHSYNGHLVIRTANWHLDLTSEAFDRPLHNIESGGPLLVRLNDLFQIRSPHPIHAITNTARTYTTRLKSGIYTMFDEPNNLGYRSAPDWKVGWHDLLGDQAMAIIEGHLESVR